jgi:Aminoglycoside-2''-adenylyltransferase
VTEPWCVAGGWAIDLFLGRRTREHDDIEVAVGPQGFEAARIALADHELVVVGDGLAWPPSEQTLAAHHQTWVRDPETGAWRLDLLREPWEGDTWVFRRHHRICLPLARVIARTPDGIPYARPEIVLLFKAKAPSAKDEADLTVTLPHLEGPARAWLRNALTLVHPSHRWLAVLWD